MDNFQKIRNFIYCFVYNMEKEEILKEYKEKIDNKKLEKIFKKEHKKRIKQKQRKKYNIIIKNGLSFGLWFAIGFSLGLLIFWSLIILILVFYIGPSILAFAKDLLGFVL